MVEENTTNWADGRSFRFMKELDDWIVSRAKTNLRSINSEVAHILLNEKARTDSST